MKESLQPGLTHTFQYTVPAHRTVPNLLPESSDFAAMPDVLATGYMVGLAEWACMECMREHLDDGEISLGTHVDLSHTAPTIVGSTVTFDVAITSVEGRAIWFDVVARDEYNTIGEGRHRRNVVSREKFESRLPGQ